MTKIGKRSEKDRLAGIGTGRLRAATFTDGDLAEMELGQLVIKDRPRRTSGPQAAVKLNHTDIEGVLPCFTPGTVIATAKGERRVETLQTGDRVITRDSGMQRIRWVGTTVLTAKDLRNQPALRPILLRANCLGPGRPHRDMYLSPNHRILFNDRNVRQHFQETEVMAAAKHMTWAPGISEEKPATVTYIHFMFARHELVLSDGLWSESFQAGDYTLRALDRRQRAAIYSIFPDLEGHCGMEGFEPARRVLTRQEAKMLAANPAE